MLILNILGWEVSVLVFVLVCCGVLLLTVSAVGLLIWLCCCCYGRQRAEPSGYPKRPHSAGPDNRPPPGPGGYPLPHHPALSPLLPPHHVALPLPDPPPPLLPLGPRGLLAPHSPGGPQYSPAVVKKWEEQLQATLFRKMSLEEVRVSTGNFNRRNYVGEGAFAVVFQGQGPNGVPWAVKRSKQQLAEGSAGEQDFEKEVFAISCLSHKHLVRLMGYCVEAGEHILIYEYCPNGSLSSALYASRPELSFRDRVDIAIGTAEALYYLHSASSPPIIHRDVKPDNVFLDSQLQAKLGDFGLLKNLVEVRKEGVESSEEVKRRQGVSSVYTRIAGTPGYLDPEYHLTSKVTAKGDVYSFGVLLLQLCTGQRAILPQHPRFNELSQLRDTSGATSHAPSSEPTSIRSPGLPSQVEEGRSRGNSTGFRGPESATQALASGSAPGPGVGTRRALAGVDGGDGGGGMCPGEPIHISTWLAPYVQARVVEPVADYRFGNNYNKTALFRILEIGLVCVQSLAKKRPPMSTVSRWLHEVREELEGEVEEHEGQYSSVSAFDREALEPVWRGDEGLSAMQTSGASVGMRPGPVLGVQHTPGDPSHVSVKSSDASFAQDGSSLMESARMREGR